MEKNIIITILIITIIILGIIRIVIKQKLEKTKEPEINTENYYLYNINKNIKIIKNILLIPIILTIIITILGISISTNIIKNNKSTQNFRLNQMSEN